MPNHTSTTYHADRTSVRPWAEAPGSARARHGLPAPRHPSDPGRPSPVRGRPGGVPADMRTLRELCHDVAMPAASIRLLAGVAARESGQDTTLQARLRQIADEAARIADICGHFLDPSRSAGPADLQAMAAEAADSARSRHGVTIEVTAQAATAAAHPMDVGRIMANLLDNACRAAGPGGQVRLVVESSQDRVRLVVADSGRGFGHGESGQASLGLGIVAALVNRNGADLRMGAAALGGLAVAVTFPAGDAVRGATSDARGETR